MAYAFDQENYLQVICEHVAGPSDGLFPKGTEYYNPAGTGYPTYDPAKAKALVKAWMHDNGGKAPVIPFGVTATPESQRATATALDYYTAVGFEAAVVAGDAGVAHRRCGPRLSFTCSGGGSSPNVDPDLNYIFWAKTAAVPRDGIVTNFARFQDDAVQAALDQPGRQPTRRAASPPTRRSSAASARTCRTSSPTATSGTSARARRRRTGTIPPTRSGRAALGMLSGIIWPTEVWKTA